MIDSSASLVEVFSWLECFCDWQRMLFVIEILNISHMTTLSYDSKTSRFYVFVEKVVNDHKHAMLASLVISLKNC